MHAELVWLAYHVTAGGAPVGRLSVTTQIGCDQIRRGRGRSWARREKRDAQRESKQKRIPDLSSYPHNTIGYHSQALRGLKKGNAALLG